MQPSTVAENETTINDVVFEKEEIQLFMDEIISLLPFKYKPIYKVENEIRVLMFNFDNWENNVQLIQLCGRTTFKFGRI